MTGLASKRSQSDAHPCLRGGLVGSFDDETDQFADAHVLDALESEGGERPLDGLALRVGDPFQARDLDDGGELHVPAPYQSARRSPVIRS